MCSFPCSLRLSPDASPQQLVNTFHLPSGVGATCVLKTAFNNTLDQPMQTLNLNSNESKMLAAKYFDAMCIDSFTQGLPLSNFVPPPPSPAPSDYPVSMDEDLLRAWNSTTFSTIKGITCIWCVGLSGLEIHLQVGQCVFLQEQLQVLVKCSLPWPWWSIACLHFWFGAGAGPTALLPVSFSSTGGAHRAGDTTESLVAGIAGLGALSPTSEMVALLVPDTLHTLSLSHFCNLSAPDFFSMSIP